jgi:hypothetical protein
LGKGSPFLPEDVRIFLGGTDQNQSSRLWLSRDRLLMAADKTNKQPQTGLDPTFVPKVYFQNDCQKLENVSTSNPPTPHRVVFSEDAPMHEVISGMQ